MKRKLHLIIELPAAIISNLIAIVAIYVIPETFAAMSSMEDHSYEKIASLPYMFNTIFLCLGAILGTIAINWGLIRKFTQNKIKHIILFRILISAGIATVSIFLVKEIPFSSQDYVSLAILMLPLYTGLYYAKHY